MVLAHLTSRFARSIRQRGPIPAGPGRIARDLPGERRWWVGAVSGLEASAHEDARATEQGGTLGLRLDACTRKHVAQANPNQLLEGHRLVPLDQTIHQRPADRISRQRVV